jgi:hypothetical protein
MIVSLMTITGTRYEQIVMRVFDYHHHFQNLDDSIGAKSRRKTNRGTPTILRTCSDTSHVYNDPHDRYMPSDAPENGYIYPETDESYEGDEDDQDKVDEHQGPSHAHFNDYINRIIHFIRRAMLRIDEGEPAIIMWRHFDCYDPWIGLYGWGASCHHGHGDWSRVAHQQRPTRYLMSVMKKYLAAAWRDGSGGHIAIKKP